MSEPKIGMVVLFQIAPGEFKPLLVTKISEPTLPLNIDGRLFIDSFEEERTVFRLGTMVSIGSFTFLGHDISLGDTVGTWKFQE